MRLAIDEAARELHSLKDHLEKLLPAEDVDTLRSRIQGMSLLEWLTWSQEHEQDICVFLHSTPSEQRRLKRFRALQPLLTLAAYQRLDQAEPLLQALRDHNLCEPIHTGRSWLASAGLAYAQVMAAQEETLGCLAWPWGEPNPLLWMRGDE